MSQVYIDCINNSELCETMSLIHNSSQEFYLKFTILTLILLYFLYMFYRSSEININESYYNFLRYIMTKYVALVYILFSPLFYIFLILDMERFYTFLFGLYGGAFAIILGLVSLWGKNKVLEFMSKDSTEQRRENKKYGKKKY